MTSGKIKLDIDFRSMKLKVGLEVHQQLSTRRKLFCDCPPFAGEEKKSRSGPSHTYSADSSGPIVHREFRRALRPTTSELGELDQAARFESRKPTVVHYLLDPQTSCLVEADEEPPHPISFEAIETSILFALSLGSRIVDEIHVMRKIVVDGSNTSGFQRTAAVALGGRLSFGSDRKTVAVQSISVEEDAARAVKIAKEEEIITEHGRLDSVKHYALDRLGTPLIEVVLAPVEGSPEEVENAAKSLGRLLRSTRRTARGLGTIRQDLNLSVMDGNVIEVKGVQKLEQIAKVIHYEALRQKFFYDLAQELKNGCPTGIEVNARDATGFFTESKSSIISNALAVSGDPKVTCLVVRGFEGLIGRENEFGSQLGRELGAIAKSYGLGGVIHSDELPNYGISQETIGRFRIQFQMGVHDSFVLIPGDRQVVDQVSVAVTERIKYAVVGVPAETRSTTIDGKTAFLRPRPGAARMYPETDIPLIDVKAGVVESLRREVPLPWQEQIRQFAEKYGLPEQLADPLYDSERRDLFEQVATQTSLPARYVASVLVDLLMGLSRDGIPVDEISNEKLKESLLYLDQGRFAKEALPDVLKELGSNAESSLESAITKLNLGSLSQEELNQIIDSVIGANRETVTEKGRAVQSMLMGKLMPQVRGKADGKLVSRTLAQRLEAFFATTQIKPESEQG